MKKLILILFLMVFALGAAHGQALKRVPKNNKNDSSKSEAAKQDKKGAEQKVVNPENKQQKDEFIDQDGDGVNDNISIQKPPEVKKPIQAEPPKVNKPEMSPPPPPSNPPPKVSPPEHKEAPKSEAAKKETGSSSKKSKR